jgi:C4-dicarboxylate transporter DctQ subunit
MRSLGFLVRNLEEIVSGAFLVAMFLATFTNVIARYVFDRPIPWAEEFSRYSFIWLTFLGATLCTKHGRHVIIDGFVKALPFRAEKALALLADLVVIGLALVMVYYGWILCLNATQPMAALRLPQYLVYLSVPVSGVLIFLYTVRDVGRHLRVVLNGGDS